MQGHLGNCDYRDVQCTQCGQYIQQLDMEAHQKELCAMRPTTCPHCSKDVPTQQLQVSGNGCLINILFSVYLYSLLHVLAKKPHAVQIYAYCTVIEGWYIKANKLPTVHYAIYLHSQKACFYIVPTCNSPVCGKDII